MHCISFNFTSITYLFCRYSKKQNSHWDPTRLTRIEVLLNHIKDGNSTKAKFINEDKKDGFLFMEKGFTSTNAKQCEDDQGYFHLGGESCLGIPQIVYACAPSLPRTRGVVC